MCRLVDFGDVRLRLVSAAQGDPVSLGPVDLSLCAAAPHGPSHEDHYAQGAPCYQTQDSVVWYWRRSSSSFEYHQERGKSHGLP